MAIDLFAGIPVSDYDAAREWYERLLGTAPAFYPNDREAVWEIAEHRYLYIELLPADAGHARNLAFVGDLDTRVADAAGRGVEPARRETPAPGVRKITYQDPDGNEFSFGGGPD